MLVAGCRKIVKLVVAANGWNVHQMPVLEGIDRRQVPMMFPNQLAVHVSTRGGSRRRSGSAIGGGVHHLGIGIPMLPFVPQESHSIVPRRLPWLGGFVSHSLDQLLHLPPISMNVPWLDQQIVFGIDKQVVVMQPIVKQLSMKVDKQVSPVGRFPNDFQVPT